MKGYSWYSVAPDSVSYKEKELAKWALSKTCNGKITGALAITQRMSPGNWCWQIFSNPKLGIPNTLYGTEPSKKYVILTVSDILNRMIKENKE